MVRKVEMLRMESLTAGDPATCSWFLAKECQEIQAGIGDDVSAAARQLVNLRSLARRGVLRSAPPVDYRRIPHRGLGAVSGTPAGPTAKPIALLAGDEPTVQIVASLRAVGVHLTKRVDREEARRALADVRVRLASLGRADPVTLRQVPDLAELIAGGMAPADARARVAREEALAGGHEPHVAEARSRRAMLGEQE